MKVSAEMMFIGIEEGKTKNDKPYVRAGFLQGINSEIIYLNDEMKFLVKDIKPMTPVRCSLDIQIGERTFVNLLAIDPINSKK